MFSLIRQLIYLRRLARLIKRAISLILVLAALAALLVSCSDERDFTHCELTLTLPKDFEERKSDNFDLLVTNGEATVGILRITFNAAFNQGIPETFTAKQFASFFMYNSKKEAELYTFDGVPYYSYIESSGSKSLFCLATFYRTQYAYIYVLYSTEKSKESEWRENFLSYAVSASFDYSTVED